MKKVIIGLTMLLMLSSCTSKTEYGDCIGAFDEKKPELTYKLSINNVFWGILGAELILPPIVVVVNQTLCPIGKK